ncbi:hypothetical protein DSL92_04420 [Billgrantia gudaonensis]|uniref:TonB-dependent receptor plug domain-containing protein n=1 Tax=Billgrantia gudaonensis TaxID=376427 RepID=A0A3S0R559_9GAMM|nr:hypothetical protein DSL92_04420 [Halomonas gudaonensis]
MNQPSKNLSSSISIPTAFITVATPAAAQDTVNESDQTSELPTILVSGEKVNRQLQDTATSVTVLSNENLEQNKGAASVSDVIGNIPNVVITDSPGAPVIRGQDAQGPNFGSTAFFGGTLPRATFNVDGHYLSLLRTGLRCDLDLDVDSVEVFRGRRRCPRAPTACWGHHRKHQGSDFRERRCGTTAVWKPKQATSLAGCLRPLSDELAATFLGLLGARYLHRLYQSELFSR